MNLHADLIMAKFLIHWVNFSASMCPALCARHRQHLPPVRMKCEVPQGAGHYTHHWWMMINVCCLMNAPSFWIVHLKLLCSRLHTVDFITKVSQLLQASSGNPFHNEAWCLWLSWFLKNIAPSFLPPLHLPSSLALSDLFFPKSSLDGPLNGGASTLGNPSKALSVFCSVTFMSKETYLQQVCMAPS